MGWRLREADLVPAGWSDSVFDMTSLALVEERPPAPAPVPPPVPVAVEIVVDAGRAAPETREVGSVMEGDWARGRAQAFRDEVDGLVQGFLDDVWGPIRAPGSGDVA